MKITKEKLERIAVAAGGVAAIVAGVYGIVSFVDSRVEKRLSEDETLRKISMMVRPSCIFDPNGSIIYDSGAMQLIESIKLLPPKPEEGMKDWILPRRIVVRPRQLLREPPIISVLSNYTVSVNAERGPKFDWIYTLDYLMMEGADHKKCRFRLEVLP